MASFPFPLSATASFKPFVQVGNGADGVVFLCTPNSSAGDTKDHDLVCVKRISSPDNNYHKLSNLEALKGSQDSSSFPRSLAKVLHVPEVKKPQTYPPWYVMEYIKGRTLKELSPYFDYFPDFLVFHLFIEIYEASRFLRNTTPPLHHGDIGEPGNVTLSYNCDSDDLPYVILVDCDSIQFHKEKG